MPGTIHVGWDALRNAYRKYNELPEGLQKYLDDLNKVSPGNTPCVLQVSHALNAVGEKIPERSHRRSNPSLTPPKYAGCNGYYLQAVDELEQFLVARYGKGEEIKSGAGASTASVKSAIAGRQGILLFREGYAGAHTELWDGSSVVQKAGAPGGMNEGYIWGRPRIVFWGVGGGGAPVAARVPAWLVGWWEVYDGNWWWYWFSDRNVVSYVKQKPKSTASPPPPNPMNQGKVTIASGPTRIVIDWNPADGGATQEIFTPRSPDGGLGMNGTSNRYAPLFATKLK